MPLSPCAVRFLGHCPDCDHDWDGPVWEVDCGLTNYPVIDRRLIWSLFQATQELSPASPSRGRARSLALTAVGFGRFCREACKAGTFFRHPKTYQCYFCPRCVVGLRVPRRLSRRFWLAWVARNADEISLSPLLFRTCERVARILAGARSDREPVAIDLGTVVCPVCGDRMAVGYNPIQSLVCPRCHSRSARWVPEPPGEPPGIILISPAHPTDEAVRRVILHLGGLARDPECSRPDGALTSPTSEGPTRL